MKKLTTFISVLLPLLILSLSACNQSNSNTTTTNNSDAKGTTGGKVKTGVKPAPDAQVAVIETAEYGRIVVELYPNIAPQMVERFKKLINEKFYDGTMVHRIDPNLGIIQGGDPLTKTGNSAGSLPNLGEEARRPFTFPSAVSLSSWGATRACFVPMGPNSSSGN